MITIYDLHFVKYLYINTLKPLDTVQLLQI